MYIDQYKGTPPRTDGGIHPEYIQVSSSSSNCEFSTAQTGVCCLSGPVDQSGPVQPDSASDPAPPSLA